MKAQRIEADVEDLVGAVPCQREGWNDADLSLFAATASQQERSPRGWAETNTSDLAWREANRQLGETLGVASHELKTPLTVVRAYLQVAMYQLGGYLRAETAGGAELTPALQGTWELLKRMERQVDRLNQFMDELLDVSRTGAGKLEVTIERCDLAAVVSEAVAEQRLIWPARQIVYDPAREVTAPVLADARLLGQVVTNYLTNALKYAPNDQPVEVRLEVGETEVRVCVRNKGPGLPAAEQERIWERFQKVEGIKPKPQRGTGGGFGLVLYMSRTIIEHFHGEVGLVSAPGQGSTFWCTLPLASATVKGGPDKALAPVGHAEPEAPAWLECRDATGERASSFADLPGSSVPDHSP